MMAFTKALKNRLGIPFLKYKADKKRAQMGPFYFPD